MTYKRRRYLSVVGSAVAVGSAGCSEIPLPWVSQAPDLLLNPTQQAKLVPDDGDRRGSFGWAVAMSGDGTSALVGARRADSAAYEDTGGAYVFDGAGGEWTQQAKLPMDGVDTNDLGGSSVALSNDGTTALVGASNGDSAYVFDGTGGSWTQRDRLSPDDSLGFDTALFGAAVDLSRDGTTALVGAYGTDVGSAYVFDGTGDDWTQQARLAAEPANLTDNFGQSVALSGDGTTALVGEFGNVATGGAAGSAYVFDGAGGEWTQQTRLTADDGDAEDVFGWAVALSRDGTTALVGARGDDASGSDSGSAYVFDGSRDEWTQQTKLTPVGADRGDRFGQSVALSSDGTTALVSADGDDDPNGDGAGSAHVFDGSGDEWTQTGRFSAEDGDSHDLFGWAVALSSDGTKSLLGALQDEDPNGSNAGSAYVFTL